MKPKLKRQIEDAAKLVTERAQSDNAAGQQVADLVDENNKLKAELANHKLDAGFGPVRPAAQQQPASSGTTFSDPEDGTALSQQGKVVK